MYALRTLSDSRPEKEPKEWFWGVLINRMYQEPLGFASLSKT